MKNHLKDLNISYLDIEYRIKSINLHFPSVKNRYVENFNFAPDFFIYYMYYFLKIKERVPSQDEFINFYITNSKENLKSRFFIKKYKARDLLEGLKARLYRAYPSLIRDFHFSLYLKEQTKYNVLYNYELDIKKGVDILLDDKYAIHLFTNTRRANYYRDKKYDYHPNDEYIHINVPIDFKNCKRIGSFFVYGDNELNKINSIVNTLACDCDI